MIVTYMATCRGQAERIAVLNPVTRQWVRFEQGVPVDLLPADIEAMRLGSRGGFDLMPPDDIPSYSEQALVELDEQDEDEIFITEPSDDETPEEEKE